MPPEAPDVLPSDSLPAVDAAPARSRLPGSVPPLDRPLDRLVGKATGKALGKLGLETGRNLLTYLPRRYDTWGDLTDLRTLEVGEEATMQVQVVRAAARRTRTGRPPAILEATLTDGANQIDAVLFGITGQMQSYARQLAPGTTAVFQGKVGLHRGRKQLTGAKFQVLDELDDAEREALLARPMPVYPATESLPSWRIATAVRTVLDLAGPEDFPECLPAEVLEAEKLVDPLSAYQWVHTPADSQQWREGRKRLRHEEAFVLQAALARRRLEQANGRRAQAWPLPDPADSLLGSIDAALPFALTDGQREVGEDIAAALNSTHPMQRLLQGDVGSGKTVVALRAMAQVIDGGGQAAMLAPTEVLATQHAASLQRLLGPLASAGMLGGVEHATRVHLLTGSTPTPRRREILAELASGQPCIVVGTHALLSDTVQMPGLGLVVVDEQHRFGVAQRDALRERGSFVDPLTGQAATPHLLVMTATPIPRTIAMTIFGDLETSVLGELPAGRTPITTHLVPWERPTWVAGLWRRAAQEIAAGGRVYVVCPRIDADSEDENLAAQDMFELNEPEVETPSRSLAAVDEWAENLRQEPQLAGIGVGVLTGRMSSEEKDAAMAAFASGQAPVLVATTVIEVGVDVPEATMMVILDADRFGLSQLHQLRGRVGRADKPGICMAVTGVDTDSLAFRRLQAFASTTDGFALAEQDLELRSEGDILGAAQSGRRSSLSLLRVTNKRHAQIIERARQQATQLVETDPELAEHRPLAAAIAQRLDESSEAFLEKA